MFIKPVVFYSYIEIRISLTRLEGKERNVKWVKSSFFSGETWTFPIKQSFYTAKTQYRKFETNIPGKGIARTQSQFPHLCVCERFIYSHHRSACSAAGNMWANTGNK